MGTKDLSNGNGRQDLGRADRSTPPTDAMATQRPPDVAPPGSHERSESDVSGWNPARDEPPAARQGRFHRAAAWRLGQVRTDVDDTGHWREDREGERGGTPGPYGRDDRDLRYANGAGPVRTQGGESRELRPQPADYRDWDRTGYGGEEPLLREHAARATPHRDWRDGTGPTGQELPRGSSSRAGYGDAPLPRESSFRATDGRDRAGYADAPLPRESSSRATPARDRTGQEPRAPSRRWQREPLAARDVMTRTVRTARRDSTLRELAQVMRDEDCGVVPIVDSEGRLLGLVTDRDLALRAFSGQRSADELRAGDVMSEDIQAVLPEEDLHGVIDLMGRRQVRRVPVVEPDDRLVGIIALGDLARRADQDEELQDALERISSRRSFWTKLG